MIDTSVTHPPPTYARAPMPAPGVAVTRHRPGTGAGGAAGPVADTGAGWSPARLAYGFYAVAATGAVIGQVWVALERVDWSPAAPMWARVAAVLPFALCLELLAMALAAMADQRQRLGERAYGLRAFSGVVALAAVGIIVVGHWPHLYLTAAFGALSASAYLLWLLHSAARRRDALRAAGLLEVTAPAYGPYRRARHPILTARAAELARERGLDLHASLRAAELVLRAQARRPALAAAVERAVRADHDDPLMAEIEARTLDLDAIAAELEQRADYGWWADRLSPDRTHRPDIPLDVRADMSGRTRPAATRRKASRKPADPADIPHGSAAQRITAVLDQEPDISRAELAKRVRMSVRHVRRVLAGIPGPTQPGQADPGADVRADMSARVNGQPVT